MSDHLAPVGRLDKLVEDVATIKADGASRHAELRAVTDSISLMRTTLSEIKLQILSISVITENIAALKATSAELYQKIGSLNARDDYLSAQVKQLEHWKKDFDTATLLRTWQVAVIALSSAMGSAVFVELARSVLK